MQKTTLKFFKLVFFSLWNEASLPRSGFLLDGNENTSHRRNYSAFIWMSGCLVTRRQTVTNDDGFRRNGAARDVILVKAMQVRAQFHLGRRSSELHSTGSRVKLMICETKPHTDERCHWILLRFEILSGSSLWEILPDIQVRRSDFWRKIPSAQLIHLLLQRFKRALHYQS